MTPNSCTCLTVTGYLHVIDMNLCICMSYLYHHCKFIPIYIVCISSIRSLYICYVASTHKFVKTFVHLLVNKLN